MLHAGRVEAALRPQSLAAAARVALCTQVGWIAYLVLWAVLPTDAGGRTGFDQARDAFTQGNRPPAADRPAQNPDDLR